jgi:hypothetical protein
VNDDELDAIILEAFKVPPAYDYHYPLAPNQLAYLINLVAKAEREKEREACIKVIKAYQIPVGNSAAGELARDWTLDALKDIRAAIRARG